VTTPAAAPAAPAAAPAAPAQAAPAAAPAAPVASPAVPAAPAAPAASAATPAAASPAVAAPAASAGDVGESLIPADGAPAAPAAQTPEQALAAARKLVADHEAAADPNSGQAWLLQDGVMGQGSRPTWFKADKYKSVAAQAEAYPALEKRFGAFTGAPAEGKYTFTPPEGVEVQMGHPLMQEFTQWAAKAELSQEGYANILGMLVQYEAAQAPKMADIKARLGENADTRIATASTWVKANLGAEGFANFRAATTGANADAVFKLVEALVSKSGQVRLPRPGNDVPATAGGDGLAAIKTAHGAKTNDGKLRVDVDPAYRQEIEKRYREYFAAGGV